eukprot:TRINITY_DN7391_c0_g1_i1.p1 TRINITY_DN7391_c0_g1~~TRINITY_DN7391_c0_g1_i1.p1  ORF type:complete len:525 (+),score=139.87 TRINITY_DN7391_c0_g1_i1:37-1575(+)
MASGMNGMMGQPPAPQFQQFPGQDQGQFQAPPPQFQGQDQGQFQQQPPPGPGQFQQPPPDQFQQPPPNQFQIQDQPPGPGQFQQPPPDQFQQPPPNQFQIQDQPPGGAYVDPNEDRVGQVLARIDQSGIQLNDLALQVLGNVPRDFAIEMLSYVADNASNLPDPSSYILRTASDRGFPPPPGAGDFGGGGGGDFGGGGGGGIDPAKMEELLVRAQQAGLQLTNEALNAIANLPPEHSAELLEFVLEKGPELRDPSNYIVSTVARGFTSRKSKTFPQKGFPPGGKGGGGGDFGGGFAPVSTMSSEEAQQALSRQAQRVQDAGVVLDENAKNALATLPGEHAAEMLEYVADNAGQLRNPSNYISSTVARGFVPRGAKGGKGGGKGGGCGGKGGDDGFGKGSGGKSVPGIRESHVPQDCSQIERRILVINATMYANSEKIDLGSYLALRCLPEWRQAEILSSLEAKSGMIGSPCNYIQAAVTKAAREARGEKGGGKGGGYGNDFDMGPPGGRPMW